MLEGYDLVVKVTMKSLVDLGSGGVFMKFVHQTDEALKSGLLKVICA